MVLWCIVILYNFQCLKRLAFRMDTCATPLPSSFAGSVMAFGFQVHSHNLGRLITAYYVAGETVIKLTHIFFYHSFFYTNTQNIRLFSRIFWDKEILYGPKLIFQFQRLTNNLYPAAT